MKCRDEELNAKLYNNRATAYFYMGENQFCSVIHYLLNVEPSEPSFWLKILDIVLELMLVTNSGKLF